MTNSISRALKRVYHENELNKFRIEDRTIYLDDCVLLAVQSFNLEHSVEGIPTLTLKLYVEDSLYVRHPAKTQSTGSGAEL